MRSESGTYCSTTILGRIALRLRALARKACSKPGARRERLGRSAMAADLRVVALGWSQDHVELFFGGIEAGRQRLAELLHAIRTERLACGHLAGELQGEDGGTRWCAGCEREAGIRAECGRLLPGIRSIQ